MWQTELARLRGDINARISYVAARQYSFCTERVEGQSQRSKVNQEVAGVGEQVQAALQLYTLMLPRVLLCVVKWKCCCIRDKIKFVGSNNVFISFSTFRCTDLSLGHHHPEVFSVTCRKVRVYLTVSGFSKRACWSIKTYWFCLRTSFLQLTLLSVS